MTRQDLEQRVTRAAEAALAEQRFVSAIDVLLGLGWLTPSHLDQWRQGRVESLESVVQANLRKVMLAMAGFRRWARDRGLNRQRPTTSPALATAASCGLASAGMPPSSARTGRTGCRRTCLSTQSSGRADRRISS